MDSSFVKVCDLSDLEENRTAEVEANGSRILVVRVDGSVFALENICTHDGGSLGGREVVQGEIECPRHGAKFNVKSGEATQLPAVADIRTYEVKVENGSVYVGVG
jgi:3-phenylpropionate/trans-cinnamate dioxygenase ferredoxin subunit